MASTSARVAACEAIHALGLLKESAIFRVVRMLALTSPPPDVDVSLHPREVCTAYRKEGAQLTPGQKKLAGIRRNAFFSLEAYADLTQAGRARPMEAHELTLLRASATEWRARKISGARSCNLPATVSYGQLHFPCSGCERLTSMGAVVPASAAYLPPHDCTREACSLSVSVRIDYLSTLR